MTTMLTIRPATRADAPALARLAALDSSAPLAGDVVLAEVGGDAVAALSYADDRAIADPFVPTAGIVRLLRVHAAQTGGRRRGGVARSLGRLAPARLRPV